MQNIIENMMESIEAGHIKKTVSREKEIQRLTEILCRSQKNNPIIIGKFGVGCTSVVEGLAWKLYEKKGVAQLKNSNFLRIRFPLFIHNPDFSFRFLKELFQKIQTHNKSTILIFDDFDCLHDIHQGLLHTVLMWTKQLLLQKNFKVIMICNATFYKQFLAIDTLFSQMCVPVLISEPTYEQAVVMVQTHTSTIAQIYHLEIDEHVIEPLVLFAQIYCPEKRLPSSAIELLDNVAARLSTLNANVLTVEDVITFLNDLMGVPRVVLSSSFKEKISHCAENIGEFIFGQSPALNKIQQSLQISEMQIRPFPLCAVLLFAGPAGVGKAYTGKVLSDLFYGLPQHYLRVNLKNFALSTDFEKLIGPYRTNIDGILAAQIKKHPYSVCVFENMECAHPEVLRGLEHVLTKGSVGPYSLANTIVILTMTQEDSVEALETETLALRKSNRLQLVANDLPGYSEEQAAVDVHQQLQAIQAQFKDALSTNFLQKISFIPFTDLTEDSLIELIHFHLELLIARFYETQKIILTYHDELPAMIFETLLSDQHTPKDIEYQFRQNFIPSLTSQLLKARMQSEAQQTFLITMNEKSQLVVRW